MSRTTFRHQIDGYDIELDLTGRDYGVNRMVCYVRRGPFVRELADLERDAFLYTAYGKVERHVVPIASLEAIKAWVQKHIVSVA